MGAEWGKSRIRTSRAPPVLRFRCNKGIMGEGKAGLRSCMGTWTLRVQFGVKNPRQLEKSKPKESVCTKGTLLVAKTTHALQLPGEGEREQEECDQLQANFLCSAVAPLKMCLMIMFFTTTD